MHLSSRSWYSSCRRHTTVSAVNSWLRGLATEVAAATGETTTVPPPSLTPRLKKPPPPILHTSVILNRSPIITRVPSLFERAYYAYQARIQRALHNPFPYEFYFKQGSLLESKFNLEERRRERKMFGKGFGADSPDAPGAGVTAEDLKKFGQSEDESTASRVHPSDLNGDVKSLDRKGQRNLYLLLQKKEDGKDVWRFPQGEIEQGELLHEAAGRDLRRQCGEGMDTWIVSRNPIGLHEIYPPTSPTDPTSPPKTCVFFYKAHIMAGQVQLDGKDISDFAWLAKEEISKRLEPEYWNAVKDMLSDF
ncbi:hypothetical protein EW146_g4898 [Bondarzewia mesenterica]|uniref:Large ribosomal subunit protein mL46 n=1 Tax=Bondarzewia mesenterica TaxID=1095465 RepID=A0A4V3XF00_9AGAM|nr:hypothetical protein EW146_g4898 [Bondarzewia mesenterica]